MRHYRELDLRVGLKEIFTPKTVLTANLSVADSREHISSWTTAHRRIVRINSSNSLQDTILSLDTAGLVDLLPVALFPRCVISSMGL